MKKREVKEEEVSSFYTFSNFKILMDQNEKQAQQIT